MKRFFTRLFMIAVVAYAAYSHYLSYFTAKRLIYASYEGDADIAGSGRYTVDDVAVDSILYHGRIAVIHYRLTGSYQNASIDNAPRVSYNHEPGELEVKHGFFGWH